VRDFPQWSFRIVFSSTPSTFGNLSIAVPVLLLARPLHQQLGGELPWDGAASCSAFGKLVMNVTASRNVRSLRPSASNIDSENR
jgi:hypothetical protein